MTRAQTPLQKKYNASDYTGNFTLGSLSGDWVGPAKCLADYAEPNPPVPYGDDNMNQNLSMLVEEGFKTVRGRLTEGRYLTFEADGYALTNDGGQSVSVTPVTDKHDDIHQRWVIHAQEDDGTLFTISSAVDGMYISTDLGKLVNDSSKAQSVNLVYSAANLIYTASLGSSNTSMISIDANSKTVSNVSSAAAGAGNILGFEIFSVSYHS